MVLLKLGQTEDSTTSGHKVEILIKGELQVQHRNNKITYTVHSQVEVSDSEVLEVIVNK